MSKNSSQCNSFIDRETSPSVRGNLVPLRATKYQCSLVLISHTRIKNISRKRFFKSAFCHQSGFWTLSIGTFYLFYLFYSNISVSPREICPVLLYISSTVITALRGDNRMVIMCSSTSGSESVMSLVDWGKTVTRCNSSN